MTHDPVHRPSHYTAGKIEVIEFIEDQRLPYHLGNVVKYVARAGRKAGADTGEDLRKAAWYLRRYLEITDPASVPLATILYHHQPTTKAEREYLADLLSAKAVEILKGEPLPSVTEIPRP